MSSTYCRLLYFLISDDFDRKIFASEEFPRASEKALRRRLGPRTAFSNMGGMRIFENSFLNAKKYIKFEMIIPKNAFQPKLRVMNEDDH